MIDFVINSITGSFGAFVMVALGFLSMFAVPIGLGVILISLSTKAKRSWRFYAFWSALPVCTLGGAIGTFILRSVLSTFFAV